MRHVDSIDRSADRDVVVGLAWMGRWNSRTETLTVSIPDTSRELIQQTRRVDFRVPTTPDDRIILSKADAIYERVDRVNHVLATQIRALSTDRLVSHTHLQRVASGLPVYRLGGGRC